MDDASPDCKIAGPQFGLPVRSRWEWAIMTNPFDGSLDLDRTRRGPPAPYAPIRVPS